MRVDTTSQIRCGTSVSTRQDVQLSQSVCCLFRAICLLRGVDGMPLFRVDLATIEGLDEEGEVVVHEGDGPKALAKAALRYYREQRQEGCAADGSGAKTARCVRCPLLPC